MSDPYEYDDDLGPPECERCGEPCHHCAHDFEMRDRDDDD